MNVKSVNGACVADGFQMGKFQDGMGFNIVNKKNNQQQQVIVTGD